MTQYMQPEIEKLEQALAAARATGDQPTIAESLYRLGDTYRGLRNFQLTSQYYDEAFTIARQESDTEKLFRLGFKYLGLQERSKALQCFQETFTINASYIHQSLFMMAETVDRMGDKIQAIHYLERALAIAEALGEYENQIMCLDRLARKDVEAGKQLEAIQKYNRARTIAQEHDDKAKEADSLADLANIHKSLGNQQEAISIYEQALELTRQTGDRTEEILLINQKGNAYEVFGDQAQALAQFEQALMMARQYHDRTGECDSLYNLGMFQKKLGNLETAIKHFEEGYTLVNEGDRLDDWGHRTPIAFFLYTALVKSYESIGNNVAAFRLLEQNLADNRPGSPQRIQELEEHIAHLRQKIAEQETGNNQHGK